MAVPAEEYITRLDVPVDNLAGIEVGQTVENALGDLPEDLLAGAAAKFLDFTVHAVERAALAEFHRDGDGGGRFVHEGAIVLADVFRGAVFVEFQFAENLLLNVRIGACCYYLGGLEGGFMMHNRGSHLQCENCFSTV